jgi:glucokinase
MSSRETLPLGSAVGGDPALVNSESAIEAIDMFAGAADPKNGVVINPPNLPCWRNFPLGENMRRLFAVPVSIDNDANAAALAEARWGSGRGYRNVFYAGLGTGIGTGIVFDGEIYHGRTGAAAAGGHVGIDIHGPVCGCGKRGCIEMIASGPAIARRQAAVSAGW